MPISRVRAMMLELLRRCGTRAERPYAGIGREVHDQFVAGQVAA